MDCNPITTEFEFEALKETRGGYLMQPMHEEWCDGKIALLRIAQFKLDCHWFHFKI